MHPRDVFCKDYSHRCVTISVNNCTMPILADVCKRTCGLCNINQYPGFPPSNLTGKLFYKFQVTTVTKHVQLKYNSLFDKFTHLIVDTRLFL